MGIFNKKYIKLIIIVLASILLAGLIYFYIWYKSIYPNTDNAYVMAHVVKVSPEINGKINNILVKDYQKVTKETALLQIDPTPFFINKEKAKHKLGLAQKQLLLTQTEIEIAKAKLEQYKLDFANTTKQLKRLQTLLNTNAVSQASFDETQAKFDIAKKQIVIGESDLKQSENKYEATKLQVNTAQEELNQATLDLEHTVLKAPADGIVMNLNQRVGDFITTGQPALSLVETQEWWIDANFKETQLSNIRPGNLAKITLDIYPNRQFQGVVEAVSSGSGAVFSLLPPENAVGNWIKVTQRFTVKIRIINIKSLPPLRMGASCEVAIDTRKIYTN